MSEDNIGQSTVKDGNHCNGALDMTLLQADALLPPDLMALALQM